MTEANHVHVAREGKVAKFWLDPLRLERSGDFGRAELREIERLIDKHQHELLEAWHEFFGH